MMKAEIIAVGTELLLGQIVNTNAQYLAQSCAEMGVDVYFQTVVGDNADRLVQALTIAASRAQLIICTGGLGPTQDDITKDVVAQYVGKPQVLHEPSMEHIHEVFRSRGMHMVESNIRQAEMIEGCTPLINEVGLAVGVALTHGDTHIVLLPGPPREMKPMFHDYARPWIIGKLDQRQPLFSKMLKFAGIGESSLEHELLDLIQEQQDPTIAPYAKEGEVTVRLTTRALTHEEAEGKFSAVLAEIRRRLSAHLFAEKDVSIEQVVVEHMIENGIQLSAAESCTGGLFSDQITSISGSSLMFRGGIVCYTNQMKNSLLRVPLQILEGEDAPGAISVETAEIMADNLLVMMDTDYAVAITGVAGPMPSEGKPVGLIYIALARKGEKTVVNQVQYHGNRDTIKLRAVKQALYLIWKTL